MTRIARHLLRALPLASALGAALPAQSPDPRVGLAPGVGTAGVAIKGLTLVGHADKAPDFVNPNDIGDFGRMNSDLAFRGNLVFQGSFHGIQVWDVSTASAPRLVVAKACPGGQGDPSVWGNLLFMSVEERRGRIDCAAGGPAPDSAATQRFMGVRIFDISDLQNWKQVAAVQTCRGSHTHTVVPDPQSRDHIYVYVSGTSGARSGTELAGCNTTLTDSNSAYFRIEVIRVPLNAPQEARVVNSPRLFADASGNINGLWRGGAHGEGTQTSGRTDQCHDITVYPAIGMAAGACSGNGLLIDIRDPANPKRVDQVIDPNFAYWHSATFNNAGTSVLYTDEWGGGTSPRCRSSDKPRWGANAIFTIAGQRMGQTPAGYFKLPAAQTATENCVAHNGSLIPVPGRDIMVQGWYQGGVSVIDFTDPANVKELAYFDRGPVDGAQMRMGGSWGAYWHNGRIYSSEIARGLDILELAAGPELSQHEIDAAKSVTFAENNPQYQQKLEWAPSFTVARAYLDQLARSNGLSDARVRTVTSALDRAQDASGTAQSRQLRGIAASLRTDARRSRDRARVSALAQVLTGLAGR
jgi:hypothetical protein